MEEKYKGFFKLSVGLIVVFVAIQFLFLAIHAHVSGVDSALGSEFMTHLPIFLGFLTPSKFYLIYPLVKFIALQLAVYLIYAFLLCYVTVTISQLFGFSRSRTRYLLYFNWLVSVSLIVCGNMYWIPHSYFSSLMQDSLLAAPASMLQLSFTFYILLAICLMLTAVALYRTNRLIVASLAIVVLASTVYSNLPTKTSTTPIASANASRQPNIIILGFDAMRPDYLHYVDKRRLPTPNFDAYMQQAVVFNDAVTPDARTFPTWLSILTADYPLHHKGRDDNIDLSSLRYHSTLGLELQKQGYETIFASDDNRFNNVNQHEFGFDRLIGPSGNAIDMIVSGMNDLPLTNILQTTIIGKFIFADYIGNHGTPHLYEPRDFIKQFSTELAQRNANKPLFLAAHFNVTAWPFFYLNPASQANDMLSLYKQAIQAGDQQLAAIVSVLNDQQLLNHTIFILVSDHGITLQLPGDRVVDEANYQGNKSKLFVKRTPYYNINFSINSQPVSDNDGEAKIISVTSTEDLSDPNQQRLLINKLQSPLNPDHYGVDTSWGYGNDLLSLKQNHAMMAIRLYGLPATPHQVAGRVTLMDIAPTVLDLIQVAPMQNIAGISLKSSVLNSATTPDQSRPLFFETSYTIPEIEQGDINVDKVLLKSMKFYQINRENGLLSIVPEAVKISIANKQRAIIQGDWMLAYYPTSIRTKYNAKSKQLDSYELPAYTVLVNLKSGEWTTNLQQPFAATAPVASLQQQIQQFYGDEMNHYHTRTG